MNAVDFLQDLALANWRFWIEDGRLKYRAPRDAVTPSLLAQLKQYKSEIFHLLENAPEELNLCQLSYGQRALWFLWELAPHSSAYNLSLPLRIHQHADADAWLEACRLLLKQHPMLRTIFPRKNEKPVQQVKTKDAPNWVKLDAAGWSEARLLSEMATAHEEPFDLERGPVARFRWFQLAEQEHILLITMHHIVSDGWSVEIIRRQLPMLYERVTRGYNATMETPTYTYHDYVRWQLEMLDSRAGEDLWRFWEKQLSGPLPVLNLHTDYTRPCVKTYNGAVCSFTLPKHLRLKLRALAKDEGATLYATLLASFLGLLHRYTGQMDLIVGSPNAGRSRAEFAAVVGYFVDPVVIRSQVSNGQTFKEFLAQTRRTASQALEHSDFPFVLLVERLRLERDPSRSPVFDATFNYLTRQSSNLAESVQVFDITQADGKFDLTLTLTDNGDSMAGSFGYNKDLFSEATVARLSEYFKSMLESIVSNPEQKLENIPLVRAQSEACSPVLVGPRLDLRATHLVHRLFEAQAALRPDEIAVKAEGVALSYAELNRRANGLALHLQRLGVKRESLVAVCANRSAAFVVAILAIHKAGGAYVPLDPGYPQSLIYYMVGQAGVRAILTEDCLRESLSSLDAAVICMDSFFADPHSRCEKNPETVVDLRSLAYVMYTSGSTGTPKGVAVEHRSLSGYVQSMLGDLRITERSNFALASTLSADLGNTVIFPSLSSGGCLHILSEEVRLDGAAFADYLRLHTIDYLKIVPSHFAALTASTDAASAMPREALILGGEAASCQWVERLQSSAPHCRIINHYGPTEATVGVLTYAVDPNDFPLPTQTLPLRTPTANTEIYLLDRNLQAVPSGMIGELYIGGDCLARGYINAPDLTRKSFVPFGESVIYRTGDIARLLPGGDVELLGREDRQIKVRGYRVELSQVEATLGKEPLVRQCVVLPNQDGAQAEYLVAFIVPAPDAPDGESIKRHLHYKLEQTLPRYMVPDFFVLLDEIPLTLNGKADTKSLRQRASSFSTASGPALPRDLVELELSRIWAEVLDLPRVGIAEDFFRLGGHSLLAVRLAGRIYERFKRRISLATLFTSPTIERMADVLRSSEKASDNPVLIPIQPAGSNPPLLCLPGAGGNVLYFYPLSRYLGADQPCLGFQALGLDENAIIPTRVEDIASRYVDIIRKEGRGEGPYCLAGHSFGAFVAFEMTRQLLDQGQAVAFLGVIDNAAPAVSEDFYAGWDHREWLKHIAIRIGKLYKTDLNLDDSGFAGKNYHQQIEYLIDRLIAARLLPVGLNKIHFSRFIEVYKANAIAAVEYRPSRLPTSVGLTLFKAAEDDPELDGRPEIKDPALGWNSYTAHPVDVVKVPGTHLTMFSEPHVQGLADRLRERIARITN
jgi:amino acid adenylation domain-containing protein